MKKSITIGISGGSGSGKTSFIRALRKEFDEEVLTIISQDDYYKPREEQEYDENGIQNFDLPTSIDIEAFTKDLTKVKNGETVSRIEYTFNNEKANASTKVFKPARVIIVEGLFIFHDDKIKSELDFSIIVNAKDSDKIIRRIKRDQIERNYPLDDVLYRYKNHVMPAYDKYIKPYLDEVDIIINNNNSYDKGVIIIKNFINSIL